MANPTTASIATKIAKPTGAPTVVVVAVAVEVTVLYK
jgi:hypothetical protein